MRALMLSTLLFACRTDKSSTDTTAIETVGVADVDADGDGYTAAEDCNDNDASVFPSAIETCDGIDNDCDGTIDEDVGETYYADVDGDSFGDPQSTVESCSIPSGCRPRSLPSMALSRTKTITSRRWASTCLTGRLSSNCSRTR